MPIYEYKCENGHVFDMMRKISDDPLQECIECGAPVRKVLHPVGISFKGSGFYSTDYSKGGKKAEPASKNGGTETKADKTEQSADKKTESSPKEPAKKQD